MAGRMIAYAVGLTLLWVSPISSADVNNALLDYQNCVMKSFEPNTKESHSQNRSIEQAFKSCEEQQRYLISLFPKEDQDMVEKQLEKVVYEYQYIAERKRLIENR